MLLHISLDCFLGYGVSHKLPLITVENKVKKTVSVGHANGHNRCPIGSALIGLNGLVALLNHDLSDRTLQSLHSLLVGLHTLFKLQGLFSDKVPDLYIFADNLGIGNFGHHVPPISCRSEDAEASGLGANNKLALQLLAILIPHRVGSRPLDAYQFERLANLQLLHWIFRARASSRAGYVRNRKPLLNRVF